MIYSIPNSRSLYLYLNLNSKNYYLDNQIIINE